MLDLRRLRVTAHDLLVATNRNTGGIIYERLEDALDRLAGTRIKTNIATGDEVSTQNFGLIDVIGKYLLPEIGAFIIYATALALLTVRPQGLIGRPQ